MNKITRIEWNVVSGSLGWGLKMHTDYTWLNISCKALPEVCNGSFSVKDF